MHSSVFFKICNINSALRYVELHIKEKTNNQTKKMHQLKAHEMFMPGHTQSNCTYSVLHATAYLQYNFINPLFPGLILLSAQKVAFYSCHGLIFCNCLLESIIIDILHIMDITHQFENSLFMLILYFLGLVLGIHCYQQHLGVYCFIWYFLSSRFFKIYTV